MRSWPQVLSFSLGIVPVVVLCAIVGVLGVRSLSAIQNVGLENLFGDRFSSQYGTGANVFGLQPAVWGTVMTTFIVMIIAVPVSMAMALVSTEFSLGIISRAMRIILGVLGGIPSIVYALSAVVFVTAFMIPKFSADSSGVNDFTPEQINYPGAVWPPGDVPFNAGAWPWGVDPDPNSTLLGGFVIALFVIPFLAPMLEDALRSVPSAPREASAALGTSRWHTLRRVVLPYAAPAMVSAIALATLKALGDVLIIMFVIGFESAALPTPIIDTFERTPGLPSIGANLLGGFQGSGSCSVPLPPAPPPIPGQPPPPPNFTAYRCDTAYFSAFLLVMVAFAIVLTSFYLRSRLRKRLMA